LIFLNKSFNQPAHLPLGKLAPASEAILNKSMTGLGYMGLK
jgi:hypothetical protein